MKYAYQVNAQFGVYPLLGSAIRAIGKGWRVGVSVHPQYEEHFRGLQHLLKDPYQLEIISQNKTPFTQKLDLSISDKYQLIETALHSMNIDLRPDQQTYDLISQFSIDQFSTTGVTAITGNGKGKTTSAIGIAGAVLSNCGKAIVIQWFKEKKQGDLTWAINEHFFPEKLKNPSLIEFHPTGLGFFGSPNMDRVKGDQAYQQHREKAYEGLALAKKAIESKRYDIVILDELVDAVQEIAQNIEYPLIDLKDVEMFLDWVMQQPIKVVVTGRRVTDHWQKYIQTSIVISEIKHPWSTSRQGAVSGLDF